MIRAAGVSVYTVEEATAAIESGIWDVVQMAYNLMDQRMGTLFPLAREHGVGVVIRSVLLKGILTDRASGVFSGRIVVMQDAQKTDAVQSNANLLLTPDARALVKPQLEIYADDVKCTHGATIGQLEEDAIFYLRSRGLDETTARGLLVYAFAAESLERMDLEPVRTHLRAMLLARLPRSARLAGLFP